MLVYILFTALFLWSFIDAQDSHSHQPRLPAMASKVLRLPPPQIWPRTAVPLGYRRQLHFARYISSGKLPAKGSPLLTNGTIAETNTSLSRSANLSQLINNVLAHLNRNKNITNGVHSPLQTIAGTVKKPTTPKPLTFGSIDGDTDHHNTIEKLGSGDPELFDETSKTKNGVQRRFLGGVRNQRRIVKESHKISNETSTKEAKEAKETKETKDAKEAKETKETKETKENNANTKREILELAALLLEADKDASNLELDIPCGNGTHHKCPNHHRQHHHARHGGHNDSSQAKNHTERAARIDDLFDLSKEHLNLTLSNSSIITDSRALLEELTEDEEHIHHHLADKSHKDHNNSSKINRFDKYKTSGRVNREQKDDREQKNDREPKDDREQKNDREPKDDREQKNDREQKDDRPLSAIEGSGMLSEDELETLRNETMLDDIEMAVDIEKLANLTNITTAELNESAEKHRHALRKIDTADVERNHTLLQKTAHGGWRPYRHDCSMEKDDFADSCPTWMLAGYCETNPSTRFLFCRRTCLCLGPDVLIKGDIIE